MGLWVFQSGAAGLECELAVGSERRGRGEVFFLQEGETCVPAAAARGVVGGLLEELGEDFGFAGVMVETAEDECALVDDAGLDPEGGEAEEVEMLWGRRGGGEEGVAPDWVGGFKGLEDCCEGGGGGGGEEVRIDLVLELQRGFVGEEGGAAGEDGGCARYGVRWEVAAEGAREDHGRKGFLGPLRGTVEYEVHAVEESGCVRSKTDTRAFEISQAPAPGVGWVPVLDRIFRIACVSRFM